MAILGRDLRLQHRRSCPAVGSFIVINTPVPSSRGSPAVPDTTGAWFGPPSRWWSCSSPSRSSRPTVLRPSEPARRPPRRLPELGSGRSRRLTATVTATHLASAAPRPDTPGHSSPGTNSLARRHTTSLDLRIRSSTSASRISAGPPDAPSAIRMSDSRKEVVSRSVLPEVLYGTS